jgi:hypothetical protein
MCHRQFSQLQPKETYSEDRIRVLPLVSCHILVASSVQVLVTVLLRTEPENIVNCVTEPDILGACNCVTVLLGIL